MLHALNKQTKPLMTHFFFFFKIYYVKKIRSVSKEDTNQFLFKKNSDLHLMKIHIYFLFEKNSDLHLMKMQINLLYEKNSDLHLMKMQIHFYLRKRR